MECSHCGNEIAPGLEIIVDELSGADIHCPYCLGVLKPQADSPSAGADGPDQRDAIRRKAREKFVERLAAQSDDGMVHCPFCVNSLSLNDRSRLINGDHFRCPLCGRDLAVHAYREEAYHAQRWLPVIYALEGLVQDRECRGCGNIRVIAKACQQALSWMPGSEMQLYSRVSGILRHARWGEAKCDPESCVAVRQYRKLAGKGLLLL